MTQPSIPGPVWVPGRAREREELLRAGARRVEKVKGWPLQEVESRKRTARAAERR